MFIANTTLFIIFGVFLSKLLKVVWHDFYETYATSQVGVFLRLKI